MFHRAYPTFVSAALEENAAPQKCQAVYFLETSPIIALSTLARARKPRPSSLTRLLGRIRCQRSAIRTPSSLTWRPDLMRESPASP